MKHKSRESSNNPMIFEEYNQLDRNFTLCSGANSERANKCLHHTSHKMLAWKVMSCFGTDFYYKVKQLRRAITEEEQRDVRLAFTEMGYDGAAIEFDRYVKNSIPH